MSASSTSEHPTRIGAYRIVQVIGEGGMGIVYEAEQKEPVRRRVAVKMMKVGMDTKEVVGRFEAERQALAVMEHPGIAKVLDAGATEHGRPYFVMELVRGIPLDDYCDQQCLVTRQRVELFIGICQAVQHAHQKGVIHRDLKPGNVLVMEENGRPRPMIIDFGIAKATGQKLTEHTVVTTHGQAVGTLAYMSPEQAEMSGLDVDTRTDIYSLGVMLYELLAGTVPLDPQDMGALPFISELIQRDRTMPTLSHGLAKHEADRLNRLASVRGTDSSGLRRELTGDLQWIVLKGMEKDRGRRYETASGMAMDLQRYLDDEPIAARPPTTTYRFKKFVRRNKAGAIAGAAAVLALLVGIAGTTAGLLRSRDAEASAVVARDDALAERDRAEQAREEVEEVVDFMVELFNVSSPMESAGAQMSAREVLDRGAERIDSELGDRPLTRARMLGTMGDVYQSLGLYDIAERQKREELTIRRRELGDGHSETAAAIDGLASLHMARADYALAEELSRESLAIYSQLYGNEHLDVAGAMSDIGVALFQQGNAEGSLDLTREALDIARRLPDVSDEALEGYVRRMAIVLDELGRSAAAEPLYQESLALTRRIHGGEHPLVAFALDNLAILYDVQGEYDRAEPLYRESLAMLMSVYGDAHPEIAQTMSNLGEFLIETSESESGISRARLGEAERLHREAFQMNLRFRPDHPGLGDNVSALGRIRQIQGEHEEAETQFREALRIYSLKLAEHQPRITDVKSSLSESLVLLGRTAEAEGLLLENYEALRAAEGGPVEVDEALTELIDLYSELGQADKAAEYERLRTAATDGQGTGTE